MADFLRLFPLNIVVFPGEFLNLHIFEPRYKQMVNECLEMNEPFGIVPHIDGIKERGTKMRIIRVEKTHDNGNMDVVTRGECFYTERILPGSCR